MTVNGPVLSFLSNLLPLQWNYWETLPDTLQSLQGFDNKIISFQCDSSQN